MLPIGLQVVNPAADQSGWKMAALSANVGGQTNLYLYPLDESGPR